jgi:hypothetical protein
MATDPEVTFIPAGEAAALDDKLSKEAATSHIVPRDPWEVRLSEIANSRAKGFRVPRNETIRRTQVVDSVLDAFELIGGTSRMALWANDNPGEFYKIYAKLAPKQIEAEVKHDGGIKIVHVLPRGKLD